MGGDQSLKAGEAGKRRRKKTALYGFIVNGVFELGEVARMEIEIQKLFSPASPQPRCPCWHPSSTDHWPASLHQ
jgi:hypothetical protein